MMRYENNWYHGDGNGNRVRVGFVTNDDGTLDWDPIGMDELTFHGGNFTNIIPDIQFIKCLECRDLPNCVLPKKLPSLEVLKIVNCPKIKKLPYMPNLKRLIMRNNSIEDYHHYILTQSRICSLIASNILGIDLVRNHLCKYL